MALTSRLRRLQFSMRTLLVFLAFTGIAFGWVAYHLNWLRQRRDIANSPNFQHVFDRSSFAYDAGQLIFDSTTAPWQLRMFGETGYSYVTVRITGDVRKGLGEDIPYPIDDPRLYPEQRREMERVGKLFPEARVLAFPP